MLAALGLPIQGAAAQLGEKNVLTLAAAQKMVAAAQAEAERNHLAGWWMTGAGRSCCCG
jgi:glc operon protein GlcG